VLVLGIWGRTTVRGEVGRHVSMPSGVAATTGAAQVTTSMGGEVGEDALGVVNNVEEDQWQLE
jgi:hypothetical protein